MSIAATADVGLELLDALMAPDDCGLHDAAEGRALGQHILDSPSPIVVLYGPARADTREFIRRWVVPALIELAACLLFRGRRAPAFAWPERRRGHSNLGWLRTSPADGRAARGAASPAAAAATTARQVRARSAGRLSQPPVPCRRGRCRRFSTICSRCRRCRPKFLDALDAPRPRFGVDDREASSPALARDLERPDAGARPRAGRDSRVRAHRARGAARPSRRKTTTRWAGSPAHPRRPHRLPAREPARGRTRADIGWAVLQEVVRTRLGAPTDLVDVAHRFDVAVDVAAGGGGLARADRRVLRANTKAATTRAGAARARP